MTNQQPVPKTCDWIKARAECSTEQMFMLLRERIDSDVKAMRSRTSDSVELRVLDDRKFVVSVKWDAGGIPCGEAVGFERTYTGTIAVKNMRADAVLFTAKPGLNAAGECQLEIEGETGAALELWQVSRRALEPFFFRG